MDSLETRRLLDLMRTATLLIVSTTVIAQAQSTKPKSADSQSKNTPLTDILIGEATGYSIQLTDTSKTKLKLEPTPLLRWVNPVRNRQFGLVYV